MTREEIIYNNRIWYLKTYEALIKKALLEQDFIVENFHVHHILPRCMGGDDSPSNLVKLEIRTHIIAHMLLSCMYPDNFKLLKAATMMTSLKLPNGESKRISSRLAANFAREYGEKQKGKVLSDSTRMKMSLSRKGREVSDSTRQKISKSEKGKIVSEDTIQKIVLNYNVTQEKRDKLSKVSSSRMKDPNVRRELSEKLKQRGDLNKTNYRKVIDPSGKIFDSIKDCADNYSVSSRTIINWIKSDNKDFFYLTNNLSKKVQGPDGTVYDSLRECSSITKHSRKALKNWIKNYPEKGFKFVD